jgi:ribonuclease BN (tRNA processing enzyme)
MHLQFIGCGDAFGSGGRFNTCFHVVGERANFLIDCGASSLIALKRFGIDRQAIDAILITHFHGDHFGGIPYFMLDAQFGKRARPLVIAGPPGLEEWFVRVMEATFEHSSRTKPAFDFKLVTLPARAMTSIGALDVTPFPVVHGQSGGPFFAYRIEVENRVIAYTGDTEWTDALVEAGRYADLLIAEAYFYDKVVRNHLSLKTLEDHLPRINPKMLVLTHMHEDMLAHGHRIDYVSASDGMVVAL